MRLVEIDDIKRYENELIEAEKSPATTEKYIRDIKTFTGWLGENRQFNKERVIQYKEYLKAKYKVSSINSMLVAINRYFQWLGWNECCMKGLKAQQQMFTSESRELKQHEYEKLVAAARRKKKEQLAFIIETIAGTGIRMSELVYITAESVVQGRAEVSCKGKWRQIYLIKELRKRLMKYCRRNHIRSGPMFRTRNGNPMNRSNIWSQMKKLSQATGIELKKVFPHNLRHLFARGCSWEYILK
ncbi:tyrosine-type recombinase/integrase [Clostridium sp.]